MNKTYRDVLASRVAGVLTEARAAAGISHATTKGSVREVLVRGLFRPLLQADIGIGHGQIATWSGALSPQQDLILFDRRILPPITYEPDLGLFPIEGVLATIEIKSTLTLNTLRDAHDNATQVCALTYLTPTPGKDVPPGTVESVVPTLFAFESDLSGEGKTEQARYQELYQKGEPPLRAICVAGRALTVWDAANGNWHSSSPKRQHDEVLGFIVGLLSSLPRISARRGSPQFAQYLFDE